MPNNWTREAVIHHLVEREAKGLPLTVGGQGVDKSLYGAARRIFGSWRNAIRAAGIAPQQVLTWERWSPARILVMIRHLARRDCRLSTAQMERQYHNLVSAARRHFGSWSKAVVAAGVEPTKLRRVIPWNPERVVEAILTRALRNESLVARLVEPPSLVEAGHRFFGDWRAAVSAAGLDPAATVLPPVRKRRSLSTKVEAPRSKPADVPRQAWSKERVIAALHARLQEQKPMYAVAIARDDHRLYQALRRHLRNWTDAMHAAGLDADVYRRRPARRLSGRQAAPRDSGSCPSQTSETLRPDHPV